VDDNKLRINLSYKFNYGGPIGEMDYGFSRGRCCLGDRLAWRTNEEAPRGLLN